VGSRLVTVRATLAAALVVVAISSAAAPPGDEPDWLALSTTHFLLFSDAGETVTRGIADDLEELQATLADYAGDDADPPHPTYVYIFRNHARFAPFNLLYEGRPAASSGYFTATDDASYIAIDADSAWDARAIVYHEYFHHFAASHLPGLPLWFEEGLSQLSQSFRRSGAKVQMGLPDAAHLGRLNTAPLIPLHDLFRVDHQSALYNEPASKPMFYAESWALVHYLLVGSEQRRTQAPRFIALLIAGMPQEEALATAFATDPGGLQDELDRYVKGPVFRSVELPAPSRREGTGVILPMSRAEVRYRLGDLLAHQPGREGEAAAYLRAALEARPTHAPTLAGLALLAERQGRWKEAARWYERAAAAAPTDADIQYRLGAFVFHRGSDTTRAIRALERSTELAPASGPAWAELTLAYLATGREDERALQAAATAHRLVPDREDVTRSLLRLYLRTGRRPEAVALVEGCSPDAGLTRARGLAMVAAGDLHVANELVARGELEAAAARADLAEEAAATAADGPELRQRLAFLRNEILRRRISRTYNAAVGSYNRGDVDEARRILAHFGPLPSGPEGDDLRSLGELMAHPGGTPPPGVQMFSSISEDQMGRLNLLLGRGDLAGASAYLDELRGLVGAEQAPWIDAKQREIHRVLAHNTAVAAYNRAVDQFNAAAYGAAAATLEELLASDPPDDVAGDARALLEESRAAIH
jgi:tetratricopeptide (TPR) repeat protein